MINRMTRSYHRMNISRYVMILFVVSFTIPLGRLTTTRFPCTESGCGTDYVSFVGEAHSTGLLQHSVLFIKLFSVQPLLVYANHWLPIK